MGVSIVDNKVDALLKKLIWVFRYGTRPIMKDIGTYMSTRLRSNFIEEGTLMGDRWKPLTRRTLMEKMAYVRANGIKRAMPTLVRTGAMRKSIRPNNLKRDYVEVGTFGIPYAKTHQYGSPKRRVPQRKFITYNTVAVKAIARIVGKHILKHLNSV